MRGARSNQVTSQLAEHCQAAYATRNREVFLIFVKFLPGDADKESMASRETKSREPEKAPEVTPEQQEHDQGFIRIAEGLDCSFSPEPEQAQPIEAEQEAPVILKLGASSDIGDALLNETADGPAVAEGYDNDRARSVRAFKALGLDTVHLVTRNSDPGVIRDDIRGFIKSSEEAKLRVA